MLAPSLDELPPQTRRLLAADRQDGAGRVRADADRAQEYRFTRRTCARHAMGRLATEEASARLEELEYLVVHRGGRGQSMVYELVFDARRTAAARLPGLIESEARTRYDGNVGGEPVAARSRPRRRRWNRQQRRG